MERDFHTSPENQLPLFDVPKEIGERILRRVLDHQFQLPTVREIPFRKVEGICQHDDFCEESQSLRLFGEL